MPSSIEDSGSARASPSGSAFAAKTRLSSAAQLSMIRKNSFFTILASSPKNSFMQSAERYLANRFLAGFLPGFFRIKPSLIAFVRTACSVRPSFLLMNESGSFSEVIWRNASRCSAVHRLFGWTITLPDAAHMVGISFAKLRLDNLSCARNQLRVFSRQRQVAYVFCSLAISVRPSFLPMKETGSLSKSIRRKSSTCSAVQTSRLLFGGTIMASCASWSVGWLRPS